MNFPHKNMAQRNGRDGSDQSSDGANHLALLAHAIVRQSLSHSAQAYCLQRDGGDDVVLGKNSELDDRIKYFAGSNLAQLSAGQRSNFFVRGHFRPDLVSNHQQGKAA